MTMSISRPDPSGTAVSSRTARRRWSWIAALATIAVVGAGCGDSGSKDSGAASSSSTTTIDPNVTTTTESVTTTTGPPISVTMWSNFTNSDQVAAFEPLLAECKDQNIDITSIPQEQLGDSLDAAAEAGGVPDLIQSDFTGELAKRIAGKQLISIEEIGGTVNWGAFVPGGEKLVTVEGQHWGLPLSLDTSALYYNLDLLKAAGFDGPPKTLDELVDMSKKLIVKNPDGSLKSIGFVPDIGDGSFVTFLGMLFDGKPFSDDGAKVTVSSNPGFKASLDWQRQFFAQLGGQFDKFSAGFGSYDSSDQFFLTGQVAMYLESSYFTGWPKKFGTQAAKSWQVAPFPTPTGSNDFSLVSGNGFYIPRKATDTSKSLRAAQCLANASDGIVALETIVNNIPANVKALNLYEAKVTPDLPQLKAFIDLARSPNAIAPPESVIGGTFDAKIKALAERDRAGNVADLGGELVSLEAALQSELDSER